MKSDELLKKAFGIDPTKDIKQPVEPTREPSVGDDLIQDYQKTRDNLSSILEQTQSAIQTAISVAKSSEHPRAFEALATLIKSVADVNTQLLDTHIKMKKIKESPTEKKVGEVNNNTFFGSTAELGKLIKKIQEDEQNK